MQPDASLLDTVAAWFRDLAGWVAALVTALFAWFLKREIKKYDGLSDSVSNLLREIPMTYATKPTVQQYERDVRDQINDHRAESRNQYHQLDERLQNIERMLMRRD